jgi:hypothetical protein
MSPPRWSSFTISAQSHGSVLFRTRFLCELSLLFQAHEQKTDRRPDASSPQSGVFMSPGENIIAPFIRISTHGEVPVR